VRISSLGDAALVIHVASTADAGTVATIDLVRLTVDRLRAAALPGVVDVAAGSGTVTLFLDPAVTSATALGPVVESIIGALVAEAATGTPPPPRTVSLPVCYGGAHGPDLAAVATHTRLTAEEVVRRHAAATYRVAMIGFLPGFPYLVGLPAELATPRLAVPRQAVPPGAIGIAGDRTGVYPLASPGGWQIIGRTPRTLFRPHADPPGLLAAGDVVRFVPVDAATFARLAAEAAGEMAG
jgi:inhibitor of KinA